LRPVIDVLRSGIKHGAHHLDLFYGTPSPGNPKVRVEHVFGDQKNAMGAEIVRTARPVRLSPVSVVLFPGV